MDKKEFTASNFIPEKLLDIICILERDEKHLSYKIIRNKNNFSLIAKFGTKNAETTPLENNASAQKQQVIRTRNKFLPKTSCVNQSESSERKKSSPHASGVKSASQHTDKNQDSSNVGQAEQPKLKKKTPAQVARDRARRKAWKRSKIARQLRAKNFAAHTLSSKKQRL